MLSPLSYRAGNQEIVDGYLNPQKVFEALDAQSENSSSLEIEDTCLSPTIKV